MKGVVECVCHVANEERKMVKRAPMGSLYTSAIRVLKFCPSSFLVSDRRSHMLMHGPLSIG